MKRRIGLVALAVILALVGTGAVYTYAHNADKRAVQRSRSTKVVYAAKSVPVGTTWKQAKQGHYLTEERVPIDAAPATAIARLSDAIPDDEVATANIAAGQIAVREMFGAKQADTGILAIPRGMQAVSVNLPSNADVAKFVQSGSQVAIYGTWRLAGKPKTGGGGTFGGQNDDPKLYITKLILARVDVIATSENAPSKLNGAKQDSTGSNNSNDFVLVTLAVDQKGAERLILAEETGHLYLSLLSSTSETAPDGGTINLGTFDPAPIFKPGQ